NSSRGGNITINTNIFEATNGGQVITTASSSGNAGNITVKGTDRITLSGSDSTFAQRLAKFQNEVQNEGSASGLFASTRANSTGSGGNIAIKTGQLIIQDAAEVSVSSKGKGDAGDIEVNVRDLSLDNQGKLISETQSGRGGNITLEVRDLLLMRRNSQISTNAGIAQARGDGGNITINTPLGFLVAAPNENSDITANAFSGSGGKVTINAKSMFGFVPRTRGDLVRLLNTQESEEINPSNLQTNDITAFSQQNPSFNGIVDIKSPDVDPSQGLLQLPVNVVDTSRQIVASCNPGKLARSKFTLTGRGGIVSSPTEQLTSDAVLSDWITVDSDDKNRVSMQNTEVISEKKNTENISGQVKQVNQPAQIVEAHGWIVDANGNIVLVSQAPNAILSSPALATASCPAQ
ncbi:MAG: filamentous hemagglutinin N-terminal domain-containing protein, partial [Trichormus sp.]